MSRLGHKDLATVACSGNAGSAMHVDPGLALVREQRLSGMQSHANPNRTIREGVASLGRCGQCVGCLGKSNEECVALRVDLDTTVARERGPQHAPVVGKKLDIAVTELLQQTRRSLHVCEKKRD